ncbi:MULTISPECIES: branched-chain amino acid ABC transporter permease [unclassified Bradyrhizobium]|uniref:branched-chain amino acid ABC transporter permease n=1 Tax=unclassified Bradyrhizobium TaxID=2631580 RepID=UPI0028E5AF26|nr:MULTISPECIES: branched-chain amino acid ABC transporter permease [unclassified Bradyrhizobium]
MHDLANAFVLLLNYLIVPATTYGCQLALGALGVSLLFSVLRFSNFAHGELMSFGTMTTLLVTWWLQARGLTIQPLATALLALPVGIFVTVLVSLGTDRCVYRYYRAKRSDPIVLLIVSIGVMLVMSGIVRFIIGTDDRTLDDGVRFVVSAKGFRDLTGLQEGLAIRATQIMTIVLAAASVALLFWFLHYTKTGKAMRAYADNEDLAGLSGISAQRVVTITWILAAMLATLAGVLYGLDKSFRPFVYQQLVLPIFAAAIVGGFGNPVGAIIGGFIVAFSEVALTYSFKRFLGYVVPADWTSDSLYQLISTDYKYAVSFVILVVVLIVRPSGFLNRRSA